MQLHCFVSAESKPFSLEHEQDQLMSALTRPFSIPVGGFILPTLFVPFA